MAVEGAAAAEIPDPGRQGSFLLPVLDVKRNLVPMGSRNPEGFGLRGGDGKGRSVEASIGLNRCSQLPYYRLD
jgi:hypothetical protein